jgi:hypothetical protein
MGMAHNHEYVQRIISYGLENGIGAKLIYVAFDDGPVYLIDRRKAIMWLKITNTIGYIEDSVLLREKVYSWVSRSS